MYNYPANAVLVYDPDTVTGEVQVNGSAYKIKYRLIGFDSIENKCKVADVNTLSDVQKTALFERRKRALDYVNQVFRDYPTTFTCQEADKYGRTLATVQVHI